MTAFDSLKQSMQGAVSSLANRALTIGLVAIAILTILWTGFHFFVPPVYKVKTTSDVRNLIISGVQNETELITASTTIKATVVIQQVAKILGQPIGETDLVYEGVGTVHSGINLAKIEVTDLEPEHHTAHVLLPAPTISEVNLDIARSSTLANYRKWFGPQAGAAIYEEAQREVNAKIRQQACANHILEAANANAAQLVKNILAKVDLEDAVVDIQAPASDACPLRAG